MMPQPSSWSLALARRFVSVLTYWPDRLFHYGWGAAAHKRDLPIGSKVDVASAIREFECQKKLLLSFSSDMEREFLDLGDCLCGILTKATSLRDDCVGIKDLLSGREEEPAIQFSFQLLKKAEDLVLASYNQYRYVFEAFEELGLGQNKIRMLQSHLSQALRALAVVTIQFRIQTGACDAATRETFLNLAKEMNELLQQVEQVVEQQFQELQQIQTTSDRLVGELSNTITRHRSNISGTLQSSREQLGLLDQALRSCGNSIHDLSGQTGGIQTGVNSVVNALQCQDITSQKIQHVTLAMDEIVKHLEAVSDGEPLAPGGAEDLWRFLEQANTIQLCQLQGVFAELEQAAAQIVEGISLIEHHAGRLMDHAASSGQSAIESSVVEHSIKGMRDILGIVSSTVTTVDSVSSALDPLRSKFTY